MEFSNARGAGCKAEFDGFTLGNVLQQHPLVQQVYYPGLEDFTGHEIAKRQMNGYGGMISIIINGDGTAATEMVDGLQLFTLAASLGAG